MTAKLILKYTTSLGLSFTVGFALTLAVSSCRVSNDDPSKISIFSGTKVPDGKWSSSVALIKEHEDSTHRLFCSAVLIHPRVVVTAAHCITEAGLSDSDFLKFVKIYVGNGNEGGVIEGQHSIESFEISPSYMNHPGGWSDIAYLKLESAIENVEIYPVVYQPAEKHDAVKSGEYVTLLGFGIREDSGRGVKYETSSAIDSSNHFEFRAGADGNDACKGDSGGPAFIKTEAGQKTLGIASRGAKCGQGGTWTLLSDHICWISENSDQNLVSPEFDCHPTKSEAFQTARKVKETGESDFLKICRDPSKSQMKTIESLSTLFSRANSTINCSELENSLTEARHLNLSGFRLTDLSPFINHPNLISINLRANFLKDISELETIPNLKMADIGLNDLTTIPNQLNNIVIKGKNLQFNNFSQTQFLELCLSLPDLTGDLKRSTFSIWKFFRNDTCEAANQKLLVSESLKLVSRGLKTLEALKGLQNLKSLSLNDNPLTEIKSLTSLEALENLNVSWHSIRTWELLTSLKEKNGLIVKGESLLLEAHKSTPYYQMCPSHRFRNIRAALENHLESAPLSCKDSNYLLQSIDTLSLSNLELESVDFLSGFQNLKTLDLSQNLIGDVSALKSLKNLRALDLSGNPVSDFSSLEQLIEAGLVITHEN